MCILYRVDGVDDVEKELQSDELNGEFDEVSNDGLYCPLDKQYTNIWQELRTALNKVGHELCLL